MLFKRENFKYFVLPIVVTICVTLYFVIWRLLGLPEYRELVHIAQNILTTHGSWVIIIAGIVEGMLLVGNYFPGGIVIFLAVISAGNDFGRLGILLVLVIIGFFIANLINYCLGRFGWYHLLIKIGLSSQLKDAEEKWEKKSFKVIFLSYWQANLAALTGTAAGILRIPFKKFFLESLSSIIFWHIIWTVIIYIFREQALNAITNVYIIFGVVIGVAVIMSIQKYRKSKSI